jgi:hypothetical protein
MQKLDYNNGKAMFSKWSVVISGTKLQFSQFCTGGCEKRTRAREAEDSPMLEGVARERLVKTKKGAVVIFELCRLAVALLIA